MLRLIIYTFAEHFSAILARFQLNNENPQPAIKSIGYIVYIGKKVGQNGK